jgi:CRP/FNR family transcriptional regulator, cyclic AMP receptor protein
MERLIMNSLEPRIRAHSFFREMKPQHIAVVAKGATERTFKAGEYLMHETEPANQFFIIERGEVSVEAHDPGAVTVELEKLGKGDVLGWSWLFPPYTWHLRARAMEPTTVIVINAAHVLRVAENDHAFGYDIMKRVANVIIHRLQAARRQLLAQAVESALQG